MEYTDTQRLNRILDFFMVDDVARDDGERCDEPTPGMTIDVEGLKKALRPQYFISNLRDLIDLAIDGKEFISDEDCPEILAT